MSFKKEYFSSAIYAISVIILLGSGGELIFSFREFIKAGEGIGVYGVILYYAIAFVSSLLWFLSFWLTHNNKLAVIYWAFFLALTIFISTQPTFWAAPTINS